MRRTCRGVPSGRRELLSWDVEIAQRDVRRARTAPSGRTLYEPRPDIPSRGWQFPSLERELLPLGLEPLSDVDGERMRRARCEPFGPSKLGASSGSRPKGPRSVRTPPAARAAASCGRELGPLPATSSCATTLLERLQLSGGYPNHVEHANVPQLAARTELVHGGRRHPQQGRDLTDREERPQSVRRILG